MSTETEIPFLVQIGECLEVDGFKFTYEAAGQSNGPADVLLVELGPFGETYCELEMLCMNDLPGFANLDPYCDATILLQSVVRFPFGWIDSQGNELALFLLDCSRLLPAGHVGISEMDRSIYLRQTLHLPNRKFDPVVIRSVLGGIEDNLELLLPRIQAVAKGAYGRSEALRRLQAEDQIRIPGIKLF